MACTLPRSETQDMGSWLRGSGVNFRAGEGRARMRDRRVRRGGFRYDARSYRQVNSAGTILRFVVAKCSCKECVQVWIRCVVDAIRTVGGECFRAGRCCKRVTRWRWEACSARDTSRGYEPLTPHLPRRDRVFPFPVKFRRSRTIRSSARWWSCTATSRWDSEPTSLPTR